MMNLRRLVVAIFALLFFAAAAFADPPSRVVRLKYMNGQVSIQPGGVDDWVAATINRPLTTGDNVWTDKDSRAELHLGTAALRMNSETSVTLSNVADNTVQVDLHQGTLNLRIVQLYDGEVYEVDTPNLAFTVLKSGDYRFDVDPNGDTTLVTVRKGEGEATGDGPGVRMNGGRQAQFTGGKSLQHNLSGAPNRDGFDDWCRVRDEREDHSEAIRYVPRGVVGYEDLDQYGRWEEIRPYGHVWVPASVAVGWAPYRFGHWVWVAPWGWTWVDDAPWGFAPFHYGRWVHHRIGWVWCPGPIAVRPYYAPALVAWVGGANWGVGLSFGVGGGVGWFPLGYGEPYIPRYEHSRGYFQNVNITNTHITNITYVTNTYYNNTTNITRIKYVNERVDGAVTAVPRHTFESSRPVDRDIVRIDRKHLRDISVVHEPDIRPSRNSELGANGGHHGAVPPGHIFDRPVVSRMPRPAGPERRGDGRDERRDDRRVGGPPEGRPADRADHGQGAGRDHDRNADKDHGQAPDKDRGRGPDKDRGQSADKDHGQGPDKDHGQAPDKDRGRGPDKDRGQSADKDHGQGPDKDRGQGPDKDRGQGPDKDRGQSADKDHGQGPDKDRGQGPDRDRGQSADKNHGQAPDKDRGQGPEGDRGQSTGNDHGQAADKDHGKGNDMGRSAGNQGPSHAVPRPPEAGGPSKDAENRNNQGHSTPNNADVSRGHGNGLPGRSVPRPPERNAGDNSNAHNSNAQPDHGANGASTPRNDASSGHAGAGPHGQVGRSRQADNGANAGAGNSNAAEAPRSSRDRGTRNMPHSTNDQHVANSASPAQGQQANTASGNSYRNNRGNGNNNSRSSHANNSGSSTRAPEMQGRQSIAPRNSGSNGTHSSGSGQQASHSSEQHKSASSESHGKSKENR